MNLNISNPLHTTELTPFPICKGHLGLFSDAKCERGGAFIFFIKIYFFPGSQKDMEPTQYFLLIYFN